MSRRRDAAGRKGPSGGRPARRVLAAVRTGCGRAKRPLRRPRPKARGLGPRAPQEEIAEVPRGRAGVLACPGGGGRGHKPERHLNRHGAARSCRRGIATTRPIGMLRRPEPAPKTRRLQTGPHRHVPRRGKAPRKGRIGQRPRSRRRCQRRSRPCRPQKYGPAAVRPAFCRATCRARLPPGRNHFPLPSPSAPLPPGRRARGPDLRPQSAQQG